MTRNIDFDDFFDDYVGTGFVIGMIIIFLGLLFGLLVYGAKMSTVERSAAQEEKNLYLTLEGEEIDDSNVKEAARIIKDIVEKNKLLPEYLISLQKLSSLEYGFYSRLFFEKGEKIIELVNGESENLSDSVLVKVLKWRTFWKWWAILSWLCIVIATTTNFVLETICCEESSLEWPWRSPWVYPSIIVMSPALLPCMAIEAVYRIFIFTTGSLFNAITDNRTISTTGQLPVLAEDKLKEKKTRALEQIRSANSKIEETKEKWLQNCFKNLGQETESLKAKVDSCKSCLSELGKNITSAQRKLAKAQKKLTEWKKGIQARKEKSRLGYLKDFEELQNLLHVKAVKVIDSGLHVYTDTVFIVYDSKKYEIGMFRIVIDMHHDTVRGIENLCSTHPNGNYHPYGSGEHFCLGNLSHPVGNALRAKEYAVAVQYILKAIHSAEGDNPQKVKEWKEVEQ